MLLIACFQLPQATFDIRQLTLFFLFKALLVTFRRSLVLSHLHSHVGHVDVRHRSGIGGDIVDHIPQAILRPRAAEGDAIAACHCGKL
ncbi:hypothetical protein BI343_02325 [Chromobacterium amazonense]|nr:hypothetical protein BI343_02325 [Chromobacterium amazonense]